MELSPVVFSLLSVTTVLICVTVVIAVMILVFSVKAAERANRVSEVDRKITGIEQAVITLLNTSAPQFENGEVETPQIWRTVDGKYTANSQEELLKMMAENGDLPLNPSDTNALRSSFEEMINDTNDIDVLDNEDDEPETLT